MSLKKAIESVRKNNSFLITSHVNLEGDALGSQLAFCRLVRALGKEGVIVNEDHPLPGDYSFLPGFSEIRTFGKGCEKIEFDCLVTLDCSDLQRTGEVYRLNTRGKPVLNIDHHVSNGYFGTVNWVEPGSSSASEMVYKLYKKMGVPIDKDAALQLYTGMMTDTGSFRYSNTGSATHRAVADLLRYKIDIPGVYKQVYEDAPYNDMRLVAKILATIKREAKGKVAWFAVKKNMLRAHKIMSFDLSENILSFGRSIKGVEVCALFKENLGVKDEIRINLRSQGNVDVNKIAAAFGGGGHKSASGATIHGKLDAVRKAVLRKIVKSL